MSVIDPPSSNVSDGGHGRREKPRRPIALMIPTYKSLYSKLKNNLSASIVTQDGISEELMLIDDKMVLVSDGTEVCSLEQYVGYAFVYMGARFMMTDRFGTPVHVEGGHSIFVDRFSKTSYLVEHKTGAITPFGTPIPCACPDAAPPNDDAQPNSAAPANDVAQPNNAAPANDVAHPNSAAPANDVAHPNSAAPANDVAHPNSAAPANDAASAADAAPKDITPKSNSSDDMPA